LRGLVVLTRFKWSVGDWGACTKTCADKDAVGKRVRSVECLGDEGSTIKSLKVEEVWSKHPAEACRSFLGDAGTPSSEEVCEPVCTDEQPEAIHNHQDEAHIPDAAETGKHVGELPSTEDVAAEKGTPESTPTTTTTSTDTLKAIEGVKTLAETAGNGFGSGGSGPEFAGKDYYLVLQIPSDASEDLVRQAYKKLALDTHSDKDNQRKAKNVPGSKKDFREINEAYQVLRDKTKRALYDQSRTEVGKTAQPLAIGNSPEPNPEKDLTNQEKDRLAGSDAVQESNGGSFPAGITQNVLKPNITVTATVTSGEASPSAISTVPQNLGNWLHATVTVLVH